MNEQERAAFHQTHKDDPSVWGEAEGRDAPRQRRNLDETITVRLSAEESDTLRRMAEAKGVSYAEIMRKALKMYAGSGPLLEDRVWTLDYRVWANPKAPRPSVQYGEGFNKGPRVPTGSRIAS